MKTFSKLINKSNKKNKTNTITFFLRIDEK